MPNTDNTNGDKHTSHVTDQTLNELQERVFTTLDTLPFAQRALAARQLLRMPMDTAW